MDELRLEIGKRLREIRNIFHEGEKLTAKQFAHLLNETVDRILNYENGKSGVPNHMLVSLYYRGINPTYILTGDGSRYADNPAGEALKQKIEGMSDESAGNVTMIKSVNISGMSVDELINKAQQYTAAAGDIMKIIKEKKQEE